MTAQQLDAQGVKVIPRLPMSFEEYLAWADEDTHAEWVDGEVIVHMPATDAHQTILGFLQALLLLCVTRLKLGKVFTAPFPMRLETANSQREPDISVVTNANLARVQRQYLDGPADLVVEIISDESVRRDRYEKFTEYRTAGIPEYWIIDSREGRRRADFYRLDARGEYELFATEDDERVESSVVPGFWLRPGWLRANPPVDFLQAYLEIRGLTAEQADQIDRLL